LLDLKLGGKQKWEDGDFPWRKERVIVLQVLSFSTHPRKSFEKNGAAVNGPAVGALDEKLDGDRAPAILIWTAEKRHTKQRK